MFNNFFFCQSCLLWDKVEKRYGSEQVTDGNNFIIQRIRNACWLTKVTNTQSWYITPIAFPRKQWFHERFSMLRYTYISCLCVWLCKFRHSRFANKRNAPSNTTPYCPTTNCYMFRFAWTIVRHFLLQQFKKRHKYILAWSFVQIEKFATVLYWH
jgi:hypothetical protein